MIEFKKGKQFGSIKVLINGYDFPNEIIWGIMALVIGVLALLAGQYPIAIIGGIFATLCFVKVYSEMSKQKRTAKVLEGARKMREFFGANKQLNADNIIKQIKGGKND